MTILVAGIGNIFQGDDAFGCEVVNKLAMRALPEQVRLVDYGIRGLDLTYALLDNPDLTILIDATSQGGEPGTLYIIQPDLPEDLALRPLDTHGMCPAQVLHAARAMGASFKDVLLVGCEPAHLGGEEGTMGLTPRVEAALEQAADMVEALIHKKLQEVLVA